MFRVEIITFLTFFLVSAASVRAQQLTYFDNLERYEKSIPTSDFIDSIVSIPYSIIFDNLYSSEVWVRKGLDYSRVLNHPQQMADLTYKLAKILYLQGQYDSSTFYNLEAIGQYERLEKWIDKGIVLCELGYQTKRRDLNQAFNYYRDGLSLLKKNNAPDGRMSGVYDNYGVLFEMHNSMDSADFYYQEALRMKVGMGDSLGIPYSYNKIAQLNLIRGEFSVARGYFDRAYELRIRLQDEFGITENESFFGDFYTATKEWNQAIDWYLKSIKRAEQLQYPMMLQYNYEQLAFCYEKNNQPKEALASFRKSAKLQDELLNAQNSRVILELQERYASAEKDRSISRLQAETAQKRMTNYVIFSLAVMVLLGAIIIIINIRRKERASKDAAIISEREAGLRAVFDATEEERKRIAKDLHDGLGQQLSGLRLSWEGVKNKIAHSNPEQSGRMGHLMEVLDEACNEVRQISHTMMPKSLQEKGLLSAIEEMVQKSLKFSTIRYEIEHFKVQDVRFDERVELSVFRICQELLNNIIKHSRASFVTVQLMKSNRHLVLIVEDDGIGIDLDKASDGIGMRNISSRLRTINGQSDIEPGPERGVVVTIRVPVE